MPNGLLLGPSGGRVIRSNGSQTVLGPGACECCGGTPGGCTACGVTFTTCQLTLTGGTLCAVGCYGNGFNGGNQYTGYIGWRRAYTIPVTTGGTSSCAFSVRIPQGTNFVRSFRDDRSNPTTPLCCGGTLVYTDRVKELDVTVSLSNNGSQTVVGVVVVLNMERVTGSVVSPLEGIDVFRASRAVAPCAAGFSTNVTYQFTQPTCTNNVLCPNTIFEPPPYTGTVTAVVSFT